jgi:SlyX protein
MTNEDRDARTEARLVELEIRYTHQERLLEELHGVIVEQGRTIASLVAQVDAIRARLATLAKDEPGDEPPPHY